MYVVNFWTVSSVDESYDISLAMPVCLRMCRSYTDVISMFSGRMSPLDSDWTICSSDRVLTGM